MKEWFESWFDTHYYHILYKDRDFSEAENFILNLFNELKPSENAEILDLACGKGRHAVFVNSLGYQTTGVDLSADSIKEANSLANETLRFFEHDMREPIPGAEFDIVLNLFTSFGYFATQLENERMLHSIHSYMRPNGKLVIDFMNSTKALIDLVPHELKRIEGIDFKIEKEVRDGIIYKKIDFEDKGEVYHFEEQVQALTLNDFKRLLSVTGFELMKIFGDYDLNPYTDESDRLILLIQKRN